MNKLIICAALSAMMAPGAIHAQADASLQSLCQHLTELPCYRSEATFTVSMPQLADDVVYDLTLTQQASPADTLMPVAYLIDWTMPSVGAKGFSAYFTGHHYRFGGERLQEYHTDGDPAPFASVTRALNPTGNAERRTNPGVHRSAQFVNLLPEEIASSISMMSGDPAYTLTLHPDTTVNGCKVAVIDAVMTIRGTVAQEAEYTFDPATRLPLRIVLENNPGSLSEQTVTVSYSGSTVSDSCPAITEEALMQLYPDVFATMRQSNFRIENLAGQQLPGFALLTSTGERYSRRTSDPFRAPTVIAILEANAGFTPEVIAALRYAIDRLPYPADLIMAFTDNNVDIVEPVVGNIRPGEHLLMSAAALQRDCGAASLPAVIIADRSGLVTNVILGFNNDLAEDVIQKMALIK